MVGLIQKSEDLTVSVSPTAFHTNSNGTLAKLLSKRETNKAHDYGETPNHHDFINRAQNSMNNAFTGSLTRTRNPP